MVSRKPDVLLKREDQMTTDLAEINHFVSGIPPFGDLSVEDIQKLTKQIEIEYLRYGENLSLTNAGAAKLYIIRKGVISCYDSNNDLHNKFGEGDICTLFLMPELTTNMTIKVEEDVLIYSISKEALTSVIEHSPEATAYFSQSAAERLQQTLSDLNNNSVVASTLMNAPIEQFYRTPAGTIDASQTIQATAKQMTQAKYSCLIVMNSSEMVGIVTDKDIRQRCVAEGLNASLPVSNIMSQDVFTLDVKSTAYDALIAMTSRNLHHLPITREGNIAGMVTITDLMHQEGNNAVNFSSKINKATTIKELVQLSQMLPKLQIQMAQLGTSADSIGKSISAITIAFTIKLIKMAEKLLGPPPVPYAWLAAGSQARQEQLAHSDQDNALIIDDTVQPEHEHWFADLATFVCDGLAACGFIYCPGDIMASNSKWRQPQQVWTHYFSKWVQSPNSEALLNATVFFDLTTVYGERSLLKNVRQHMLANTRNNTVFLAHLSKNALNHTPPLGFFRDFVLVKNGENKQVLDLKHNGIAPIVDLARIYALQQGIEVVNTKERLRQVAGTSALSTSSAKNLIDALEFLGYLRSNHQAKQLTMGKKPTNFLDPKSISKLEREHLKDVFKVIKTLQNNRQVTY